MSFVWSPTDGLNNISQFPRTDAGIRAHLQALLQQIPDYYDALVNPLTAFMNAEVGKIEFFPGTVAPSGYLVAQGQLVSRTTYAALWAYANASGNIVTDATWLATGHDGQFSSGDLSTTFRLPDLRGNFVRAFDNARGVDSGRTIGTNQVDGFGAHSHNVYGLPEANTASGSTSYHIMQRYRDGWNGLTRGGAWDGAAGEQTGLMNSGISETRPKNIALLACIKC